MKSLRRFWVAFLFLFLLLGLVACKQETTQQADGPYYGVQVSSAQTAQLEVLKVAKSWENPPQLWGFSYAWDTLPYIHYLNLVVQAGMLPMIYCVPSDNGEAISAESILAGDWDDVLIDWAERLKGFEYPVFLHFSPLPNVESSLGSAGAYGRSAATYKQVYRYVVEQFREFGAHNVIWVWQVAAESWPAADWNSVDALYPGKDVVDWVAVNVSAARQDDGAIASFRKRFSGHPLMLVTGSLSLPEMDKDTLFQAWVTDISTMKGNDFSSVKSLDRSGFVGDVDRLNRLHVDWGRGE